MGFARSVINKKLASLEAAKERNIAQEEELEHLLYAQSLDKVLGTEMAGAKIPFSQLKTVNSEKEWEEAIGFLNDEENTDEYYAIDDGQKIVTNPAFVK